MILDIIKVFILSLVEGLTEFIPVSSTGHMIIVDHFIKLSSNKEFTDSFLIIIQLGAILSVLVYYFPRLWPFSNDKGKKQGHMEYVDKNSSSSIAGSSSRTVIR